MKRKIVIELETESYMEEQFLMDKFPSAKWLNLGGRSMFFIPIEDKELVLAALNEWKELEEK